MNKDLYDEEIEFPIEKRDLMKRNFQMVQNADENTEGYNRNKELQTQKWITYKQLKRIKNFFDNFTGNQKDPEYILNGGIEMKNWVDNELRRLRDGINTIKKNRTTAGMSNQFISTHSKGDPVNNVRPSTRHKKTSALLNNTTFALIIRNPTIVTVVTLSTGTIETFLLIYRTFFYLNFYI